MALECSWPKCSGPLERRVQRVGAHGRRVVAEARAQKCCERRDIGWAHPAKARHGGRIASGGPGGGTLTPHDPARQHLRIAKDDRGAREARIHVGYAAAVLLVARDAVTIVELRTAVRDRLGGARTAARRRGRARRKHDGEREREGTETRARTDHACSILAKAPGAQLVSATGKGARSLRDFCWHSRSAPGPHAPNGSGARTVNLRRAS